MKIVRSPEQSACRGAADVVVVSIRARCEASAARRHASKDVADGGDRVQSAAF